MVNSTIVHYLYNRNNCTHFCLDNRRINTISRRNIEYINTEQSKAYIRHCRTGNTSIDQALSLPFLCKAEFCLFCH